MTFGHLPWNDFEHRWEVGGGYGWLIPQLKVAACAGVPEGHLLQSRGQTHTVPFAAWSRLVPLGAVEATHMKHVLP